MYTGDSSCQILLAHAGDPTSETSAGEAGSLTVQTPLAFLLPLRLEHA